MRRAEDRLAQLLAVHSDVFPDFIAARAEVERQKAELSDLAPRPAAPNRSRQWPISTSAPHSPHAAYERNMIEREYDNIKRQYDSLREKQLEAQVAANLQSEDKGERFTVVDQATHYHTDAVRPWSGRWTRSRSSRRTYSSVAAERLVRLPLFSNVMPAGSRE